MKTGYELTFTDFKQLLSYPGYRPHITPLIREWFGYDVVPTKDGFSLCNGEGVEVSPQGAAPPPK